MSSLAGAVVVRTPDSEKRSHCSAMMQTVTSGNGSSNLPGAFCHSNVGRVSRSDQLPAPHHQHLLQHDLVLLQGQQLQGAYVLPCLRY
jgi:hypothetical protein